jgi:hypothetical protein
MKTIYDVLDNIQRTKLIQQNIKKGKTAFRTRWGMYGTPDWMNKLRDDNLIEIIEGKISNLYYSGHNDFAEFEIDNGVSKYNFERLGNKIDYKIGLKLYIECIRAKYILPTSGLEELLTPLKISIVE